MTLLKLARQLNLIIINNVIYSRYRLKHASTTKNDLILLLSKGKIVLLYLEHIHNTILHCGVNTLISIFRQECWMPAVRVLAKRVVSGYLDCKRMLRDLLNPHYQTLT